MSRRQILFAGGLVAGLVAWAAVRTEPSAQAGPAPTPAVVTADYAVNDEDTAAHRWATSQTRHWRQLVVKR